MPPSPIVKATVNEMAYARLLAELDDCPKPFVRIKPTHDSITMHGRKTTVMGLFTPPSGITLHMGFEDFDTSQLRFVSSEMSRVLLHETRHAWQWWHHGDKWFHADDHLPYEQKREEIDAYDFEDRRLHDYRGLVRVTRKFPSTPFSRLSRAEKTVRHSA